jgi:2'-5' RNA ligase
MGAKKEQKELYFIALVPEEPVHSEVWQLKEEMHKRFATRAALRSPPHITLQMPFKWSSGKEERLFQTLQHVAQAHQPFLLTLKNFGAFEPRVIYVNVEANESLNLLQQAVIKAAATGWHILPMARSRPFQPHMTIAFRDLKKSKFYQAWQEFQQREFYNEILVSAISLLKHNGKTWDVYKNYELKAKPN